MFGSKQRQAARALHERTSRYKIQRLSALVERDERTMRRAAARGFRPDWRVQQEISRNRGEIAAVMRSLGPRPRRGRRR